jgi:hypothetical protein
MFRSVRARAGVMLLGAVAGISAAESRSELIYLGGYLLDSQAAMDAGNMGMVLGTAVAGAGAVSSLTGIGASWGGPLMTAGGITAGFGA